MKAALDAHHSARLIKILESDFHFHLVCSCVWCPPRSSTVKPPGHEHNVLFIFLLPALPPFIDHQSTLFTLLRFSTMLLRKFITFRTRFLEFIAQVSFSFFLPTLFYESRLTTLHPFNPQLAAQTAGLSIV